MTGGFYLFWYNPPPPGPVENGRGSFRRRSKFMPLRVDSEIGRLRRVLIHRPGREIDWMVPSMMETLLFDDILDGDDARLEHDGFCQVLRQAGVQVLDSQALLEIGRASCRERVEAQGGGGL